jgi:hypothetical protein
MDLDRDPATLLRDGRRLKNSSQNIPHASEELKENREEWLKLQHVFAPVFNWIHELVFSNCCIFMKFQMIFSLR